MPVVHDTIIVEDRFGEVFNYLPAIKYPGSATSYNPVFRYGNDFELKAFLKTNPRPYPLIWLLYPYLEVHHKTKVELPSVSFILAVDSRADMQGPERIEETYKKILIPLFNNFKKVLSRNNIMNIEQVFNITKFPNYSDDNLSGINNKTDAIWDALKVNFSCDINNVCLKEIRIKNER